MKTGMGVLIAVLFMIIAVSQGGQGDAASVSENVISGYGDLKNMTFYFHNESTAQYIFDYSTTYIFNTILGSKMESISRWGSVVVDFYLCPQLAGNITISGNVTVVFYMNMSAESNNFNGNFGLWLYDVSYISPGGVETSVEIGNAQVALQLTTNRAAYAVTIPNVHYLVEKTHSLRARISISGGASNYYFIWFGTGNWDSRIILPTQESVHVESIHTFDANHTETVWFDPMAVNKTMYVRANITDPFGGYDIYWVNITLTDTEGNVVLGIVNASMVKVEGNNKSFLSVYEYELNYSGLVPGKYIITVLAVDMNGYYWYTHLQHYEFGPYIDSATTFFFIGGLPVYANFKCVDASNNALANARVDASVSGKLVATNITNASGIANLTIYPGNYTINVYWQEIVVANMSVEIIENVSEENPIVIFCQVYNVGFFIVDLHNDALAYAMLFITHPNGSLIEIKTDGEGIAANLPVLAQLPGGNYGVRIEWRGIFVGYAVVSVNHSSPPYYKLTANVFNVVFRAIDSHGAPISDAYITAFDNRTGFLIDAGLTDSNGTCTLKLPKITAEIYVYWYSTCVYTGIYNISGDSTFNLNCSVYYLTVHVSDVNGVLLNNVFVEAKQNGNSVASNITQQGKCMMRLPRGNYTITVTYIDTIMFTKVYASNENEVNFSEDTEITIRFVDVPPPFYTTNLFAVSVLIAVLLILLVIFGLLLAKVRKQKPKSQMNEAQK